MKLIEVTQVGFGFDGKTLDMNIVIPKDSYLVSFRVATQKDVTEGSDFDHIGREYIDETNPQASFLTLFTLVKEFIDDKGNEYAEYHLGYDPVSAKGYPIAVSKEDLTLIAMELNADLDISFIEDPCKCGVDSLTTVVALYEMMPMMLAALNEFAPVTDCEMPRAFMDKILRIKAIELALCLGEYIKAALYWQKFYTAKPIMKHKTCGCHG